MSSPRWRIPRSIHQIGRSRPLAFSRPCGGKADCPRKEKHDHKASNDLADWEWETTRWRLPRRAEKRLPGEAGRVALHVGTTTKSTWARKKENETTRTHAEKIRKYKKNKIHSQNYWKQKKNSSRLSAIKISANASTMNSHTVSIQPQIAQHIFIFSIESETAQIFALHTKDRMRSFRVRPLHASRNTSRKPKRGTMIVHALHVIKCRNLAWKQT